MSHQTEWNSANYVLRACDLYCKAFTKAFAMKSYNKMIESQSDMCFVVALGLADFRKKKKKKKKEKKRKKA